MLNKVLLLLLLYRVFGVSVATNLYFFKWNTQYFFAFLESSRQNKEEGFRLGFFRTL
jgi:hypothetical protein